MSVPPRYLPKELVVPDALFMDDHEFGLDVDADDAEMQFLDFWPDRQHEQASSHAFLLATEQHSVM